MENKVLVVMGQAPASVLEALRTRGLDPETCSPTLASQRIAQGKARLLLCAGTTAWMPLVIRADRMGARIVVLGSPPSAEERRPLLPERVTFAATLDEAVNVLVEMTTAQTQEPPDDALQERLDRAELIGRAIQTIAAQMDLPNVLQEAMARARELCDADAASLLLVDMETGELYFDAVHGGAETIVRTRLGPGEGIAGKVAQSATLMLVENVQGTPDFSERMDAITGFSTGSVIAVPLLWGGDVIGVLEAVRGADHPPFNQLHLRRLEDLAPHVAVAVHNAQMTEALRESQHQVLRQNAALESKVHQRTGQLARAKQEWEQTFDAISDPIALQDGHTLVRANRAYAAASSTPVQSVPGKACYALRAGRSSPCPGCPVNQTPTEGRPWQVMMPNQRLYQLSWFRLEAEGGPRTVVQYQDITEQRRLESRLRESERMASIGQLASGAAHEINNPLGFLMANLETLKETIEQLKSAFAAPTDTNLPIMLQDAADMLNESTIGARRMGAVVKALRELSRLEVGRPEPSNVMMALERIISQDLKQRNIERVFDLEPETMAAIPPLQLDQVLRQVLKNAVQATTHNERIRVCASASNSEVVLLVQDEGCGIATEHIRRVFEPFFTTRGVGQGMGLGLTAAYGIVRRYGGKIEVDSQLGHGTTVSITLPRMTVAHTEDSLAPSVSYSL